MFIPPPARTLSLLPPTGFPQIRRCSVGASRVVASATLEVDISGRYQYLVRKAWFLFPGQVKPTENK